MPGMDGVEATRQMVATAARTKVLRDRTQLVVLAYESGLVRVGA